MHPKEIYTTVKPKNKQLQKYIAYYYFNIFDEKEYTKAFVFYPHYRNSLTIYKDSEISFSNDASSVLPKFKTDFTKVYTGIHLHSRIGKIKSPFNKIGIVFQALGLNNFLEEPLSKVVKKSPMSNFNYFGDVFETVLKNVYQAKEIEEKTALLDTFFIEYLKPFNEKHITKAVDLMFKDNYSIQDIANTLKINRKTLFRVFKKHLNCSPKEYASIIKFRKALSLYQLKEEPLDLTTLAYKNSYYDQSDFIKHFKKTTGFNPKSFFGNISHLGSEDTFWTLLK